jgi:hypothetical protein
MTEVPESFFRVQGIGGNSDSTAGNGYYSQKVDADRNGSLESARRCCRLLGYTGGDRVVNSLDREAVDAAFGQVGANLTADVNGDVVVNRRDRKIVSTRLGRFLASHLPLDD